MTLSKRRCDVFMLVAVVYPGLVIQVAACRVGTTGMRVSSDRYSQDRENGEQLLHVVSPFLCGMGAAAACITFAQFPKSILACTIRWRQSVILITRLAPFFGAAF
jgi:hypothetical protein